MGMRRPYDGGHDLLMPGHQAEHLTKKAVDEPDSCNKIMNNNIKFMRFYPRLIEQCNLL